MKLEVVQLPCKDADDVGELLNSLTKYDKLYSFDDFSALITPDNIIEVTAAVNDLKLSIFQIKNKGDFTKEKIETAFKKKKDQYDKEKQKQASVNKADKDNKKKDKQKDDKNKDKESLLAESKAKVENDVSDPNIPLEKKWETMDNFQRIAQIETHGLAKCKDCIVDEEFLVFGLKHFKERGNIEYKNKNQIKAREV